MIQFASAVLRPASLFPQRASSLTAWYVLYGGRAADKVAPNDSVARTIAAAKPSFQYRYSLPVCKVQFTCYDLASRHSHRRRQQGPSEVRIAAKAEQLNQNNDPEGREVVRAFNPRLITCD